ncbi:Aquaporin TIP4-2 [Capsicum chinense]|nr:Aquaporin TIP4-2 [Capsicum chinense]
MFFYLTILCLQRFTSEDAPEVPEGTSDKERFIIVEAWKHSDFLCKNYILSGLQDDLYNIYSGTKTSKELWGALERKYKTEDAGIKKFFVHKRKEMTVEDLIVRLHIEEENKAAERRSKGNSIINGAQIVEDDQNNSKKRKKVEQGNNQPKKKFKGKCFNCGKIGLKSTDCRAPKKECNLVRNPREWWMDSGATRHVCANKELFSSFTSSQVEDMIYMTSFTTAKVEGTGKVGLKMTSGKALTLNNDLYVSELRRNLISVSLLDKNGFKCVTASGKIVTSKGEVYVEKGYRTEGLYKMNVEINKSSNSSYLLESYNLWHDRLGHVNYKMLRKLINLEVLPNFECNKSKCQTCVESKYAKHPYNSIERNSTLDLIHTDICDVKSTPSRGGKKYFITFIDDCTRYCYVYLLKITPVHTLANGVSYGQGLIMQVILTFSLLFTVYTTIVDPKKGSLEGMGPLLTGLVVGANIMAGGSFSGASMNPARSFGPAFVSGIWTDHWVYWIGPLIGGGFAGFICETFFIVGSHVPLLTQETF